MPKMIRIVNAKDGRVRIRPEITANVLVKQGWYVQELPVTTTNDALITADEMTNFINETAPKKKMGRPRKIQTTI